MSEDIGTVLRQARIRDLPQRRVSVVGPSTSLGEVYRILDEEHSVAVLVWEEGKLVGIFTERDILNRTALEGDPATPIERLMSPIKASAKADDRLADAIAVMHDRGFRHLPLLDEGGGELGLVGGRDVLKLLAAHFPEELLNLPPRLDQQMTRSEGG